MTAFTEIQAYPLGWKIGVGIFIVLTFFLIPRFHKKVRPFLICAIVGLDAFAAYIVLRQLETRIDSSGIHYQMRPTETTVSHITWDEVARLELSTDIMYNRPARYEIYTIGNKTGLYVYLKYDKIFIIGTKKPDEMQKALWALDKIVGYP